MWNQKWEIQFLTTKTLQLWTLASLVAWKNDRNDESQVPVGIEGIEAEETGHDHDWPKGSDDHDGPQGSNDHESPITADRDLQDFELNIDNIEPDKVEATEDDLDNPDDENQQFIDTDINS